MRASSKHLAIALARVLDILLLPLTFAGSVWLKLIRRIGTERMPASLWLFRRVGVFPVRDHYYEPLFNPIHLDHPLSRVRDLPGVDLNEAEQLQILAQFDYADELLRFPMEQRDPLEFFYNNSFFLAGDAEYLYSMIRHFKPRRIIEVGSGASTLMSLHAIEANQGDDPGYNCTITCIEPFEVPWLEDVGVDVVRERVERVDRSMFEALEANDILFVDSSHVIRPQGDVLSEYLEILPSLQPGVLVHVHDIFLPRDYPDDWVNNRVRLWNEQYLLEAFLSFNEAFRVIGAVNFLKHEYLAELTRACPVLGKAPAEMEPGSLWMVRSS